MVDQCDNCDYARPRVYGPKTVIECRVTDPVIQGQPGAWPTVLATDWCGKYQVVGFDSPANRVFNNITLNTTTKTLVAKTKTPGYSLIVTAANVTNTSANKGVMVKFFDGNTDNLIGAISVAANQSEGRTFFIEADQSEVWAQLDVGGFDVYVSVQGRRGRMLVVTPQEGSS